MNSDRDLNHLYPKFRELIVLITAEMNAYALKHMEGWQWFITEGYRSTARQKELYAQGRTTEGAIVTYKDGVKHESDHQSSLAVDFAPKKGKVVDFEADEQHWAYLGHLARSHGLEWGGDWKTLHDTPHVQWAGTDTATYAAARKWQKANGLR